MMESLLCLLAIGYGLGVAIGISQYFGVGEEFERK